MPASIGSARSLPSAWSDVGHASATSHHRSAGPGPAADRWSFDASQRTLLLRGAVARHLTGRPFCRLSLDEFLARLPGQDERTPQGLLHGPPPPQPVELKLLDS